MSTRKRRTPEEAREAILNAAETHLIAGGSARIRLQEVARDVGISHPTLLHHIGSREALVQAVAERAFQSIQDTVVEAIIESSTQQAGIAPIIETVFQALRETGYGRALAWLILENAARPQDGLSLSTMVTTAHAARITACERDGHKVPEHRETAFAVLITTLSLFAQSFAGDIAFESAGVPNEGKAFRNWLADLLESQLES